VPRSHCRARLTPSVGLLGAALLPGVAQRKADQACPPYAPYATRPGYPWSSPLYQPVPGPPAGEAPGGGRAAPVRAWWSRAAGAVCAPSGVQGRRGGPWPWPRWGWCRALARSGANARAWGWRRLPVTGSTSAVWSGGAVSCAQAWLASPAQGGGVRRAPAVAGPQAVPGLRSPGATPGGITLPRGRAGPGGAMRPRPAGRVSRQPSLTTAHRVWWPVAARVVPTGVAAVGHWEVRPPASVSSPPTRACRRRWIASAPPSLRLPTAPEAWR